MTCSVMWSISGHVEATWSISGHVHLSSYTQYVGNVPKLPQVLGPEGADIGGNHV